MSKDDSPTNKPIQILAKWFMRRDWVFWGVFMPVVILKLAIFHFATSQVLFLGYHPYFGMDFEVVEAFSDFNFYYMNFVRAFVQGNLPYTEALYMIDGSQTYIYPPLFVYILSAFYYFPTEFLFPDIQSTAIILSRNLDFLRVGFAFIVFDLATCAGLYATARRLVKNRVIPVVVMLIFALNPVSLWWGNYLWLSTPLHTFFLVVGFFFAVRGNLRWAIVWVSVATMVKQTAALLIPVIWFLEYRRGLKQLLISVGITAAIGIVLSMPYLILYPSTYLDSLTRGMGPYTFYDTLPEPTHPIPISLLVFYWPEPFKFIVFSLVYYGIPWIMGLMFFWVISYLISEQPHSIYCAQLLLLVSLLSLAAHLFMPRGIYKFYLIAMLPFLILFGASFQGPLMSVQNLTCPVQSYLAKMIAYLPSWLVKFVHRFQTRSIGIINNSTTWWFVFVGFASIALFAVHRFFTHMILLTLFLTLLVYGSYHYVWKWHSKK